MKNWLIATYKLNEVKSLERNLSNQKFVYFLPKINKKKLNSKPRKEVLFPGYIFVNISFKNYSALKYTKGIKDILKFGDRIPSISDEEIKTIQMLEASSLTSPITTKFKLGQEVIVKEGSLRGMIVKICSLPSKDRVEVLLNFLGSSRKVIIPEKNLIF